MRVCSLFFLLFLSLTVFAQKNQSGLKRRVDSLIQHVDSTSNKLLLEQRKAQAIKVDSLSTVAERLRKSLEDEKEIIPTAENKTKEVYSYYVVLGVYASEPAARLNMKKHKYDGAVIIPSRYKKYYYVALPHPSRKGILSAVTTNKEKYGDAWWVRLKQ